jgi:hypothetical protein
MSEQDAASMRVFQKSLEEYINSRNNLDSLRDKINNTKNFISELEEAIPRCLRGPFNLAISDIYKNLQEEYAEHPEIANICIEEEKHFFDRAKIIYGMKNC